MYLYFFPFYSIHHRMFSLTNFMAKATKRTSPTSYHRLLMGGLYLGLSLLFTACADHLTPPAPATSETLRQSAVSFYQALYSSSQSSVDTYVASTYIDHQSSAGFTLNGLKAYAQTRSSANSANPLIIHRTVVDGQLVGLHVEEPITADSSVAHMALLRFDAAGKIVEHWESIQGQPRRRANAHTMFDGPPVNYQSTAGKRGEDAAVAADQQAFNNLDTLAIRQSRALVYIQHNPTIADGAQGLIGLIGFLKQAGLKIVRTSYQRLSEGDCVMTLSGTQATAGTQPANYSIVFDLTRLDDAGKSTEHWDVLEPVSSANVSKAF